MRDGVLVPSAPLHRHLALVGLVLTMVFAVVSLAGDSPTADVGPRTWYVSRDGSGAGGTSWASAWTEPGGINWALVRAGDRIVLDGGATPCASNYLPHAGRTRPGLNCGMLYRTGLDVGASGTASAPITISLSTRPGRNGTAVFFGGRATPLPYCDQHSYAPSGRARDAGISVPGASHVVVDGVHRSGIMIYGAKSGVDLVSDSTSFVTLRNLEVFDNGTYGTWTYGYRTDGEGISLAGHHIVLDRDLVHDNGQDAVQDRNTGIPVIAHLPLHDITITNSWLYEHRAHPRFAGFGFNAGAQDVASQDCTHVDGLQIYGGGLLQQRLTISHDVFGPMLAQGVYPGDDGLTSFDHVAISDTLFLNVLDHSIIGPAIASNRITPHDWRIHNVTSYMTDAPAPGLDAHGKVDLAGGGHSLYASIFYNGYFSGTSTFAAAGGNVWWRGDPVVGAVHRDPDFVGPLPATDAPSYATLAHLDLTARCAGCAGAGSQLHGVADLLARIDALDRTGAP